MEAKSRAPGSSVMSESTREPVADRANWTLALRRFLERRLPIVHLLPDRQPYYVGSWVYIFGVVAIAALAWIVATGVLLVFFGPQWWHVSNVGHFVNALHFWAVQIFFVFMVLHLWGQYFAASWRDGRAPTWLVGVIVFAVSIVATFTGYVAQQNFDAQWIAINAKDAMNAVGVGAFFNVLNFGQMYGLHILFFPIAVGTLVAAHVVLVRMRGVVKPIDPPGARPTPRRAITRASAWCPSTCSRKACSPSWASPFSSSSWPRCFRRLTRLRSRSGRGHRRTRWTLSRPRPGSSRDRAEPQGMARRTTAQRTPLRPSGPSRLRSGPASARPSIRPMSSCSIRSSLRQPAIQLSLRPSPRTRAQTPRSSRHGLTPTRRPWPTPPSRAARLWSRPASTGPCPPSWRISSGSPGVVAWTRSCSRTVASSRPTSRARCSSWATATTSGTWPPTST